MLRSILVGQVAGLQSAFIRRESVIEAAALILILAVGSYLRLTALDFGQFRADDVTLWNIARATAHQPEILTRGTHSSSGIPNGPFQAYLLLPGVLATGDPIGAYVFVALLNVVGIALYWRFVREYWGSNLALLAALLYAVNPWAVVFSRRLWGNDMTAPFTTLLVWSLSDLVTRGRKRDSVLPFLWLAILAQVYVVALVHSLVAVLGLALGAWRLRLPYLAAGATLFVALIAPYVLGAVLPSLGNLPRLLGSSDYHPEVDLASISLMFHIVSSEGYQAFANQAGRLLDASGGLLQPVSLMVEVLMAIGLGAGAFEAVRHWRRKTLSQATPYILPLVAVLLPALLLVRHTSPVYPYYLLIGFPMHFLFVALGLRLVWEALRRVSLGWARPMDLLPNCTVAALLTLIVGAHLLLAQVFFTAIREYWPRSDYGLPLRYTLDIVETTRKLTDRHGFTRVYIGGHEERDSVLYRILRSDVPNLSLFNSTDSFIRPDAGAGKTLYILSSTDDRVGQVFATRLSRAKIASLDVPGAGLSYSFYGVAPADLDGLFSNTPGTPLAATFDGRVRLESYAVEPELRPGEPHQLILRWKLLDGAPESVPTYYAYVRLVDQLHKAYEGADLHFLDTEQWEPGEEIIRWHTLATPSTLEPGVYSYLVGLYNIDSPASYRNALVLDANGMPVGDGVVLGRLVVKPTAAGSPTHRSSVTFGQQIALKGYDLVTSGDGPGKSIEIALHWKALDRIERDYTVFVHLLGPDGRIVAQHDSQPLSGRYPTTAWQPGSTVVDLHGLQLPSGLQPGQYRVAVGLYYLPTGERLGGQSFAAMFPVILGE